MSQNKLHYDLLFVGEQLRKCREEAGLTQEDMAEKLELSTNTIYRFENATRVPGVDVLIKYADVMNIPITTLVPSRLTEQEILGLPLADGFTRLSSNHQKAVRATMSALVNSLLITQ